LSIPYDLANLLAVAIRDVVWFKDGVLSLFAECGVPRALLIEVRKIKSEPTIKLVHFVLNELGNKGEEGSLIAKKLLTRIYYWNDLHSIPPERRDKAIASLEAFRNANKRHEAQTKFEQEKQERVMHSQRTSRIRISDLDHSTLAKFRDEFDLVHGLANAEVRGNRFQDLMNKIFKYYCEESKGDFNRVGEQIDGLFYFEKHWWYVEIRWRKDKANAADISVLRDRARDAFGGDTKALFISFNGFSNDCLRSVSGKGDERVILMDGYDLRCVLDCQIAFDILLAEKQADIVQNRRPFVSAGDVIQRRRSQEAN
jgi:hypothetical protein